MGGSKRKTGDYGLAAPLTKTRRTGRILRSSNKAIDPTEFNQTNSPLLRLPAEIRNRIYDLALRTSTVHIFSARGKGPEPHITAHTCTSKKSDQEMANTMRQDDMRPDVDGEDSDQYTGSPYSIALLRTCKQIHHESALLPFKINTFSFRSAMELERFANRLLPCQREALVDITLGGILSSNWLALIKRMRSVQHITLFHEHFYHLTQANKGYDVVREQLLQVFGEFKEMGVETTLAICHGSADRAGRGHRGYYDMPRLYTNVNLFRPLHEELEAMFNPPRVEEVVEEEE
ncbi:uncharacterized protein LTR77_009888 [Saxophila tyrrhenica]|uniref:DUF7730 domain-containing protein n=1 Tax=Saxophila tyrrhenica TaxID=1690608 RepID=A0AAV9NXK0_9PEZI|nr:hypothetical protein LTR77_009888 [Saxophila tyrrhenica]